VKQMTGNVVDEPHAVVDGGVFHISLREDWPPTYIYGCPFVPHERLRIPLLLEALDFWRHEVALQLENQNFAKYASAGRGRGV
jgi:hypothetical protein